MADLSNSGTIFDAPVDPSFVKPARRGRQSTPKQSKLSEALTNTLLPENFAASLPSIEPRLAEGTAALAADVARQPGFLVRAGAAFAGNTDQLLAGGFKRLLKGYSAEFDNDVEAGFVPPEKYLVGVGEEELQERQEARGTSELMAIVGRQEAERERVGVLMSGGLAQGLALGMGAEVLSLTGVLGGFGAARGAMRMAAMAELANTSRLGVIGNAVKINLATGTAVEGAQQLLNQRFDPTNLFIQAGADIFTAGVFANIDYGRAINQQRMVEDAVTHEAATFERATANLPDGAAPELIETEFQRLRHAELSDPLREAITPTGANRKLMDHPDDIEADDLAQEAAGAARVADAPTTSSSTQAAAVEASDAAQWQFKTLDDVADVWESGSVRWENPATGEKAVANATGPMRATYDNIVNKVTNGEFPDYAAIRNLPDGVTVTRAVAANAQLAPAVTALTELANEYLGKGAKVLFGDGTLKANENGVISSIGNTHVIGVTPAVRSGESLAYLPVRIGHATLHELGHAIVHQHLKSAPVDLIEKINKDYLEFVNLAAKGDPVAIERRYAMNNPASEQVQLKTTDYNVSRDEWMAEQYVKHLQNRMVNGDMGKLSRGVIETVLDGIRKVVDFFHKSKARGLLEPSVGMDEFFNSVLKRGLENNSGLLGKAVPSAPATSSATAAVSTASNPIAIKYGLSGLPQTTAAERAKAKAMLNLYTKADAWDLANPMDAEWNKRTQNLLDNPLFNVASTSLNMLRSKNPVVRMIASELLEDPSGAAGARKSTAAISKHTHERLFMGNAINDVQNAYAIWGKAHGRTLKDDTFGGGVLKDKFDREVASEIEARRVTGAANSKDPSVIRAADSLESAYERIRKAQISNKTLGWGGMPSTSRGYMPHKISPSKWRAASNAQRTTVRDALAEQYVNIEGWTPEFSKGLADKVLERVHARANGGHDSPIGGNSAASAEIVQDALLTMGMSVEEVRANMQRFNRGAASWTKSRIDLDLNREYVVDGAAYKLLDIFDTDQIGLLKSQAGRASGEVALARHGVYGKPGLQTLRDAMTYGSDTGRATHTELESFDQVAAEFLNAPFGDAGPKWMDRARTLNSLARLGGMGIVQTAEFANAIPHIGAQRTLSAILDFPRLRREILALSRGEAVDNKWIGSIERVGGAEFGTDSYKIVMPFDSLDHAYPTYSEDTVGVLDRLLRGASHVQSKLSFWRAMHSVQQRGMAEQITAKIARYVRDGSDDVALQQFGITPQVRAALKKDLDKVAKWEGNNLLEFDVTKMSDLGMQEELIQSVHRGVSQIIQGTFIGETGKWAHNGYLKLITQFRTFPIVAMEKQWARQRNSRGTAESLGILVGSMAMVTPVYIARVYAASIGREDAEEYIERNLTPTRIARSSMNYIALAGLAPDFMDIAGSVAPEAWGIDVTGGRAGTDSKFVGNIVAPSLSLVDDIWKAFQNLDDPEKIAKILPGSRLPYLIPAVNALGD